MDVLCDTLVVEEILPRLPPESLVRLGAASRRYDALVHDPGFAARYWPRAGVLVQPLEQPKEAVPAFLTGRQAAEPVMPGADLAFLPGLSAAEKERMLRRADDYDDPDGVVVLHSAAGLVLCCRGRVHTALYYVCNPVTRHHVALPKLVEARCALLTVTADKTSFRVVIVHWPEDLDKTTCLDLSVFSSDAGRWELRKLPLPPDLRDDDIFGWPPILGQSGTAYWTPAHNWANYAVAYNSSSANNPILEIALPPRLPGWEEHRCVGERNHGWGLQFAQTNSSVLEVWKSDLIGGMWSVWLQVTIAELVALNPEAAGFMRDKYGNTIIRPVGFHPTDEDVVFIAMPGAVFAYSVEHGTLITLLQRTNDCLIPAEVYPYTHPDYPVQVPAIKDAAVMIKGSRTKCGCTESTPVNGRIGQRKRLRDQACS